MHSAHRLAVRRPHQRLSQALYLVAMLLTTAPIAGCSRPALPALQAPHAPLPLTDAAERFEGFSPAERLELAEQAPWPNHDCEPAVRGDVVFTVTARGSLKEIKSQEVRCTVPDHSHSRDDLTVKWLIDAGSSVKKGDLLIELDCPLVRQRLADEQALHSAALACRQQAATILEQARRDRNENQPGAEARAARAEELLTRLTALAAAHAKRVGALRQHIKAWRMFAELDGMVVYHVPDDFRKGNGSGVVAQGEPVHENQLLLQVHDMTRFQLIVHAPATIPPVQPHQAVKFRVDAFADKPLAGRVEEVSKLAMPIMPDEKINDQVVTIASLAALDEWRPGMSAEATIEVVRKRDVLRVPARAVVRFGQGPYCYLKIGQEIHKRRITLGAQTPETVEVTDGLTEGDLVLQDPRSLLHWLSQRFDRPR
jgi:multidrug efflux pump subunit AcrA (membrane-fusion protein)